MQAASFLHWTYRLYLIFFVFSLYVYVNVCVYSSCFWNHLSFSSFYTHVTVPKGAFLYAMKSELITSKFNHGSDLLYNCYRERTYSLLILENFYMNIFWKEIPYCCVQGEGFALVSLVIVHFYTFHANYLQYLFFYNELKFCSWRPFKCHFWKCNRVNNINVCT